MVKDNFLLLLKSIIERESKMDSEVVEKILVKIQSMTGGQFYYIRKVNDLEERNRKIRADYRFMTAKQLAEKYNLSERQIKRIL